MQCPYCVSTISDEALACPHCARDLHLVKQLQEKIATLEAQQTDTETVAALEARIAELEAQLASGNAPLAAEVVPPSTMGLLARLWLPPLLLLLVAHGLMTVVYDINTLYLRIASILIPLPFGLVLMLKYRPGMRNWLLAGFVMAVLAVLGMSGLISVIDKTPLLPADLREWREFLEYAASIGFSYATGMLLGLTLRAHQQNSSEGLAMRLAKAASKGKNNAEKLQQLAKKLNDIGGTLTAVGTTAISIYTGLKDFLGGN